MVGAPGSDHRQRRAVRNAHSDQGPPTVKIVAFKGQFRITLPKDLVRDKGWGTSTELRFVEDEQGRVYLKPMGPEQGAPVAQQKRTARRGGA